jgi:sortase A
VGLVAAPPAPSQAGRPGPPVPAKGRPGPPAPLPLSALMVVWVLASLSALAVWFLLYVFVLSGFQEAGAQHALYASLRTQLAQEIAPPFTPTGQASDDIKIGTPVAILKVPQAGVNDVVLEGTTSGVLEQGPGLVPDTPLPGQPGLSVIYGRQAMFGGPFRHLAALHRGDRLDVTTGQGTFTYVVNDLVYPGDPLPSALPAGQSRLTLVTAAGSGWRADGAPDQILYVETTLKGQPTVSPGGLPSAVPSSEMTMQGDIDTSVLAPLVLWLQLFLFAVAALAWARSRWGGWQTWLVGAPAVLAVLWVISETAFQLLPNLL